IKAGISSCLSQPACGNLCDQSFIRSHSTTVIVNTYIIDVLDEIAFALLIARYFFPNALLLAGFAGMRFPQKRGSRTTMPAAFRKAPAVSRRTPVACSIRRKGHPSFPSAITCYFRSSLKALLMSGEPIKAPLGVNVPSSTVGRFSSDPHWPDLGDP